MEQEQKPRERSFIKELIPDWRPSREQVLWTVRIVIVLVLLLGILALIGLPFKITLWDWMKLLIVPAVIAAGGLWFNRQQRARELDIASEQRKREEEIADRRAQEEMLQAYLDQIGNLLLYNEEPLRQSEKGAEVRILARARTLTVLRRMDFVRRAYVLQFLHESGLIDQSDVVVDLGGAYLGEAALFREDLRGVKLSDTYLNDAFLAEAKLSGTDLSGAVLHGAQLFDADLSEANLTGAKLNGANLMDANLSGADLRGADLSENVLRENDLGDIGEDHASGADLRGAKLSGADLRGADLRRANLYKATGITNEGLEQQTHSLTDTIMPDGQKYEDWLKSKGRGEAGENSGDPS